jgi:hypothetical protein
MSRKGTFGRSLGVLALLATAGLLVILPACNTADSDKRTTFYYGTVISPEGEPLFDIQASLFETSESSTTDENGRFQIESFRHFSSVGFYLTADNFSQTVRLEGVPEEALYISLEIVYDQLSGGTAIRSFSFDTSPPATPTPIPPTAVPGETPSETPPSEGNFDDAGNTTAFGIPDGLIGNIDRGRSVWSGDCKVCHAKEKSNKSYPQVKSAFRREPQMRNLKVSDQKIADVVAYLNRGND